MQDIEPTPQDQGTPRGVEPFPGIGSPPMDTRYFQGDKFSSGINHQYREKRSPSWRNTSPDFSRDSAPLALSVLCCAGQRAGRGPRTGLDSWGSDLKQVESGMSPVK